MLDANNHYQYHVEGSKHEYGVHFSSFDFVDEVQQTALHFTYKNIYNYAIKST